MNEDLKLALYLAGTIAGLFMLARITDRATTAVKQSPRLLIVPSDGRVM